MRDSDIHLMGKMIDVATAMAEVGAENKRLKIENDRLWSLVSNHERLAAQYLQTVDKGLIVDIKA